MSDIKIPNEVASQLRPLAAALGFKMSRGPGMFAEMGSIPGLWAAIAEAYNDDPKAVVDLVGQILDKRASVQEVVEMIKETGAIIL